MPQPAGVRIRPRAPGDDVWVRRLLERSWGSQTIVSRGRAHDAAALPGLVALTGDELVGLATLRLGDARECELVTLDAVHAGRGIGSALLAASIEHARLHGCRRLWLVTSNDNLEAMRFYQRRGMSFAALHRGGVDQARRLKPSIPERGLHGIPIRDELELEIRLQPGGEDS